MEPIVPMDELACLGDIYSEKSATLTFVYHATKCTITIDCYDKTKPGLDEYVSALQSVE